MTSNANVSVTDTTQILPKIWVTQSTWKRAYQLGLLCSDALMLLLAFALAYWQDADLANRASLPPWYPRLRAWLSTIACLSLVCGLLAPALV